LAALTEAINYVKTELMPDFDFDAYNHDQPHDKNNQPAEAETTDQTDDAADDHASEEVDSW
jgi:hypothetical protein